VWLLVLLTLPASPAGVVKIERISPPLLDLEVIVPSDAPAISADGRFVAFVSGDAGADHQEIYVRDRQTGKTERVAEGGLLLASRNGRFVSLAISADGRFVVFLSGATNLAPGHTSDTWGTFVRDRQRGTTEFVGVTGGDPFEWARYAPSISADGRFVAFVSAATNRVPGTAGGVFVRDRVTGKTERVGDGSSPAISADGRFVAFTDDGRFVAFPDGGISVRDRLTGTTEWVSDDGEFPTISADGRFVAFQSYATNLEPEEERRGVFVRDHQSGKTDWVADGGSPSISADGHLIAFVSWADDLPGETNGRLDIFLRDRQTAKTELVSVGINGAVASYPGYGSSLSPVISANGRFVAFNSDATNLVPGDTNAEADVFVRDRQKGTTELVSVSSSGAPANLGAGLFSAPAISGDGRFVAFISRASNLVPGDTNDSADVFVRDRQAGTTERVAAGGSPSISADGRFVAFVSWASNLVPGDRNGRTDVFVAERG
jgi:Tol biopolymer transport system component